MSDEDLERNDLSTSATGIVECLRMLADEAAELQLDDTLRALREAIAVCQTERVKADCAGQIDYGAPPDAAIH